MSQARVTTRQVTIPEKALLDTRITQPMLGRIYELHQRFIKGQPRGQRALLWRCSLSELDFRGLDFSYADFVSCDFSDADLRNACFRGATVLSASFGSAELSNADFEKADLRGTTFDKANLTGTKLSGADLRVGRVVNNVVDLNLSVEDETRGSTFRGAILNRTHLNQSKLRHADFGGAVIRDASLRGADIRSASFRGAEMVNTELKGAYMTDADFRGAFLDGIDMEELVSSRARTASMIELSNEDLTRRLAEHGRWIVTDGDEGRQFNLFALDLSRRDLSGANIAASNLMLAVLTDACLSKANLAAARLSGANLIRADLTNADLRGADLSGATLRHAKLDGAKIGELPGTGMMTRGLDVEADALGPDRFAVRANR